MKSLVRLGAIVVLLAYTASATTASAANPRSLPTATGVRALLTLYIDDLISGKAQAACALFTPKGQRQTAENAHAKSCETVIEFAHVFLAGSATRRAAARKWVTTVKITLRGSTGSVPNENGPGRQALLYTGNLWYIN